MKNARHSELGSILDDVQQIRADRTLSWTNTPDGPLSFPRDDDPLARRLYTRHREHQRQQIFGQPSSRGDWVGPL